MAKQVVFKRGREGRPDGVSYRATVSGPTAGIHTIVWRTHHPRQAPNSCSHTDKGRVGRDYAPYAGAVRGTACGGANVRHTAQPGGGLARHGVEVADPGHEVD